MMGKIKVHTSDKYHRELTWAAWCSKSEEGKYTKYFSPNRNRMCF